MSSTASASIILSRQFRDLTNPKKAHPCFHIELENDNIFLWNIGVMVLNEDSIYHGGFFKAQMKFPADYPFSPPTFRFTPAIYHPNVYRDGRLCISILHQLGDPHSDEPDSETWSPAQLVETVLISIVSLLEDPNTASPANVDAAIEWRKNKEKYNARIKQEVLRSMQDIPEGFVMPSLKNLELVQSTVATQEHPEDIVDDDFWLESEEEEEDDYDDDVESLMDEDEHDHNDMEMDEDGEIDEEVTK
ncbi:hypothetical protein BABINDRAFT_6792 [Babjeviella inositovora NRRL Y-12698]|uniref:UBC core domain-containing protein n=1 Tax=Babjeviella inositovora NRRL Y-12698 TaxID=984486 RepID=A0A1E3QTA9_9ASCO|nr:uncharacterized protein BABINDRAFT_6792 [Babjeviella inositovora NRRL Y-12698]ODQ80921.1 hypothetical protein BABINDRAFT_6792 [Babjeviella inositovora NRRL Y-12698]